MSTKSSLFDGPRPSQPPASGVCLIVPHLARESSVICRAHLPQHLISALAFLFFLRDAEVLRRRMALDSITYGPIRRSSSDDGSDRCNCRKDTRGLLSRTPLWLLLSNILLFITSVSILAANLVWPKPLSRLECAKRVSAYCEFRSRLILQTRRPFSQRFSPNGKLTKLLRVKHPYGALCSSQTGM